MMHDHSFAGGRAAVTPSKESNDEGDTLGRALAQAQIQTDYALHLITAMEWGVSDISGYLDLLDEQIAKVAEPVRVTLGRISVFLLMQEERLKDTARHLETIEEQHGWPGPRGNMDQTAER